jgi:hypothetical protein
MVALTGLMINASFTIQVWVRVDNAGPLISIHPGVTNQPSSLIFATDSLLTSLTTSHFVENSSSTMYDNRDWTLLAVSAEWSHPNYILRFSSSRYTGIKMVTTVDTQPLLDSASHPHFMGY